MNNEKYKICPFCDKELTAEIKKAKCSRCKIFFCEKHSKIGPKRNIICRRCFKSMLKKKASKEYISTVKELSGELVCIREQQSTEILRLEQKTESVKRLEIQLKSMKIQHIEAIDNIKNQIKITQNSNKCLEQAAKTLKIAFSDIKQCEIQKKAEMALTLNSLELLFKEKIQLNHEIQVILNLIRSHSYKKQLFINNTKLNVLCCNICHSKLKNMFKKLFLGRLKKGYTFPIKSIRKPEKSGVKLCQADNTEACNCIIC